MGAWHRLKLGDVVTTNASSYSLRDGWTFVNYLDTGNITENVVSEIQQINLKSEKLPSRAKRKVKCNSILYSTVRPNQRHYGIIKTPPDHFLVSTGFTVIDADETKADADFLYYLLTQNSLVESLHSIAEQSVSAYPSIKATDIENLEIHLPPLETQKKIAALLSALDEKIETNRRINKNLEEQAQVIFNWIFPKHKSANIGTIADISANVTDGVHNTVQDVQGGEYLLLSCKNIIGGFLTISSKERHISKESFTKLRKRTNLEKGDILLSSVGTVGELLLLNVEPTNFEFQRSVAIIKPNVEVASSAYIYESLLTRKNELVNQAHGAVQQCIFIGDIKEFPIEIPDEHRLKQFDTLVQPMFDRITLNQKENETLKNIRDALLPKLMSGELDVSALDI